MAFAYMNKWSYGRMTPKYSHLASVDEVGCDFACLVDAYGFVQ